MSLALEKLTLVQEWNTETLHRVIASVCEELNLGMGKVGMPLRVAITGGGQSPSVDAVMALIGQPRVLARIQKAIDFIQEREQQNG